MLLKLAAQLPKEESLEKTIAKIQSRLQFLESLYLARSEDIQNLQTKAFTPVNRTYVAIKPTDRHDQITADIVMMLKNMTGMKASKGVYTKILPAMQNTFILKLLPHLADTNSLRPSYHLKSSRINCDVVVAVPTVKRDKQSYLLATIEHLISGLREKDQNDTLIIIFVGESDLEYVLNTARTIEMEFFDEVQMGLIEVIAPSATYYPDLDVTPLSFGDSLKRVKWRTKQNLDTIYLMAYAQTRGTYYLMLEDDVIAEDNYMGEIKQFVSDTTVTTPDWFILEFCNIGGIGKLFKSSDLINFIVYVQLFYKNMPIDWLMESYLADRVCSLEKTSHPRFGIQPLYYPHDNPLLKYYRATIDSKNDHTVVDVYEGRNYFWGINPQRGQVIELWFAKPLHLKSYTFRSGNFQHQGDKFYDTLVEVYTLQAKDFFVVNQFDEFGLADGKLPYSFGPILAIRLRVNRDNLVWVVLSEIELVPHFDREANKYAGEWGGMNKNYLPDQKIPLTML